MGYFLLSLKIVGSALAGAFGVLGTFSQFRTDDGRITPRGKIALWGLSLSVLLTLVADIWGGVNAERGAVKAALRTEKIVADLDRSLRPLESFGVFVADFRPPRDDPLVAEYFRTVDAALAPMVEGFRTGAFSMDSQEGANFPPYRIRSMDEHGVPVSIELPAELLPQDRRSALAAAMEILSAQVKVYAAGKSETEILARAVEPDLDIALITGQPAYEVPLPVYYELDADASGARTAQLVVSGHLLDQGNWNSAETVVAVPDLKGATVTIEFSPVSLTDAGKDAEFQALRAKSVLNNLALRVNSRDIWFDGSKIERQVTPDGEIFWLFQLSEMDPFVPG